MTRLGADSLAAGCVALVLSGCASMSAEPVSGPPALDAAARSSATARFDRLLADSDEDRLRRDPIEGLLRGDLRRAGEFGDMVSDAHAAAERAAAEADLRGLAAIDRAALTPAGRIAYDSVAWQRDIERRQNEPALATVLLTLQLNHMAGVHLYFPDLSSGRGGAPYKTPADYDNGLARIDGFIVFLDRSLARVRDGAARGVVQPRLVIEHLIVQFDTFIAQGVEGSIYRDPVRAFPETVPAADRERLSRAYGEAIRDRLLPAFVRMRDGLRNDVLPNARTSVGLSQMPGGAACYRFLVEQYTTTRSTPEEIHRIGLAEVARIDAAMEALRWKMGYPGTLAELQTALRTDPRFRPASAAALGDGYRDIGRRVAAGMPRLFADMPKMPLEIRPTPAYQEKTDASARYFSGSTDSARPGVFYYNTYDLPARATHTMEATYLHEAVPGHHYQSSLTQENEALPKVLRFGGITAYDEGWALYAESLGPELGLQTDPYQRMGAYDFEMLRAVRLVVDTGIHAFGWSREQAVDYMLRTVRPAGPRRWPRSSATSPTPARRWRTRPVS